MSKIKNRKHFQFSLELQKPDGMANGCLRRPHMFRVFLNFQEDK